MDGMIEKPIDEQIIFCVNVETLGKNNDSFCKEIFYTGFFYKFTYTYSYRPLYFIDRYTNSTKLFPNLNRQTKNDSENKYKIEHTLIKIRIPITVLKISQLVPNSHFSPWHVSLHFNFSLFHRQIQFSKHFSRSKVEQSILFGEFKPIQNTSEQANESNKNKKIIF